MNTKQRSDFKIAAIAILYLPSEITFAKLLKSLQNSVEIIYVIDNTPAAQITWVSNAWFMAHGFNVRYQALGDNLGIAKAQNVGIEMAIADGCDHVILFDQDSEAAPLMVQTLLEEEQSLIQRGIKVGLVGPAFIDDKTGEYAAAIKHVAVFARRIKITKNNITPVNVDYLIASGSLIQTDVLKDVGFMYEDLFIDWVDIEWAIRAGKKKYQSFMIPKTVMHHSIGDDFIDVGLRKINVHNNIRKYYFIRNACHLILSNQMSSSWRINMGFKMPAYFLLYFISAKDKIAMLKLIGRAIRDGIVGRLGRAH